MRNRLAPALQNAKTRCGSVRSVAYLKAQIDCSISLAQKYINPKTERAYTGVGSKEYNDVLQQHLIPEGKKLFQQAGRRAEKWQLQQDNAPAHKTKETMQCISSNVPGGLFLEWPASSPALPPIEISGVGWNNNWVTERASTVLMTCKVD